MAVLVGEGGRGDGIGEGVGTRVVGRDGVGEGEKAAIAQVGDGRTADLSSWLSRKLPSSMQNL